MKEYYSKDGITIYNADCMELYDDIISYDILLTDPPYGMNFVSNFRKNKYDKIHGDDAFPVDNVMSWVSKSSMASYVFCRWDNIYEMPKPKSVIAWIKDGGFIGDIKHEHGRLWEAILFYPTKNHKFAKRISDVIKIGKTMNKYHPTEKPVGVISTLIECNYGELIFDPYMGSGTTLVAAKILGRKAIGIEYDERHCETAAKRMDMNITLF